MAPTPSLVVKKQFNMDGQLQTWSNRYHFVGGTPADASHWHTFMDAVVADEAPSLASFVEIVECVGYEAGSDIGVASKSYSTHGSTVDSTAAAPGDCAALIRYETAARTVKNHPVYLFNYVHGVWIDGANDPSLAGTQRTDLEEYAFDWWSVGFSDGTNTYTRAGPNGAAATGRFVSPYVTHRDFPH